MQFSIITPSFRGAPWLPLCIASVADQAVPLEHLVQDACSDDGTQDWLPRDPRVKAFIEKDQGMYDAINRGLRRATGEICAYLNCDEQYLPGALAAVGHFFETHPHIDVLFGDSVVVDPKGNFLSHRCALTPGRYHTLLSANLAFATCGTFFRRRILENPQLFFDTRYRIVADVAWGLSLLAHRVPMALLRQRTSAFTDTGQNLSFDAKAKHEIAQISAAAPAWAKALRPAFIARHRLRKWLRGGYSKQPIAYDIYTQASPAQRVHFHVPRPTGVWTPGAPKPAA